MNHFYSNFRNYMDTELKGDLSDEVRQVSHMSINCYVEQK